MPRRGREEEPEPVQIVMRGGEEPDLLLADRARSGVQGADVQAAPELPGDALAQPGGQLPLLLGWRSPGRGHRVAGLPVAGPAGPAVTVPPLARALFP